jgi:hypothetical protein
MKLEQGATVCTMMTHQLMKMSLEIQTCKFLNLVEELDLKITSSLVCLGLGSSMHLILD